MIFQLLIFSSHMAEKRPVCQVKVRPGVVQFEVHQEVFLFDPQAGIDLIDGAVKVITYINSCLIYTADGFQQRRLVIEGLAGIGNEYCWNTKRSASARLAFNNESRGRWIPCRIATGFKSYPKAAAWKAGSVRLLLSKGFSSEFFQSGAIRRRFKKSIVFFSCQSCERLKPVGIMRSTFTNGPGRSEEHTSELQSLMRSSYAVFCLKKTNTIINTTT